MSAVNDLYSPIIVNFRRQKKAEKALKNHILNGKPVEVTFNWNTGKGKIKLITQ